MENFNWSAKATTAENVGKGGGRENQYQNNRPTRRLGGPSGKV